ncbi:lysozyme [Variovorax sp. H27-G14]|uniref:lysozyme n=1 Tax=Variovorax sp. H27-G14 TaxID=3111914 RepID=UPI0038FC67A1
MNGRAVAGTIVVAGATLVAGSPFLMGFLQKWESGKARVLVVYGDKLAGGLPTVCNGLTRHVTSTPIIVGQRWTDEKCEVEERAAVVGVQAQLAPCFKRSPTQIVFDMATSHAWNLGAPATCGSGAMAAWNRGEWEKGCQRIARGDDGVLVWSFVRDGKNPDGSPRYKFVQGLANRRADEATTCSGAL